jgi:hypothetical protein
MARRTFTRVQHRDHRHDLRHRRPLRLGFFLDSHDAGLLSSLFVGTGLGSVLGSAASSTRSCDIDTIHIVLAAGLLLQMPDNVAC